MIPERRQNTAMNSSRFQPVLTIRKTVNLFWWLRRFMNKDRLLTGGTECQKRSLARALPSCSRQRNRFLWNHIFAKTNRQTSNNRDYRQSENALSRAVSGVYFPRGYQTTKPLHNASVFIVDAFYFFMYLRSSKSRDCLVGSKSYS